MMGKFLPAALIGAALLSSRTFGADELIEKACKAHGNFEAISKAKTVTYTGVLKALGGGMAKYDHTIYVRFPSDIRMELTGTEGTTGSFGHLVLGKEGWRFQKQAVRPMAPDEVAEAALGIPDIDWLGRLKRGEQKYEPIGDQKFDETECTGIKLIGDARREVKLWFDKATGLLYRRDEASKGREGGIAREYVIYEDYQEMAGIQMAGLRTLYVNQKIPDTETEKYQLAEKLLLDDFAIDAEIPAEAFQVPEDPFKVDGLSGDAAKEKAEALMEYFKGRRDPDLAGWAEVALAKLKADAAIAKLLADTTELKYFGCAAKARMSGGKDLPEDFRASEFRKKVATSQGYGEAPAKVTLKFVGSAGVSLLMGDAVVLIDALYQPGLFHTPYPALDPASLPKVDVILFTRAERNYFCPWTTAAVLNRTKAVVYGPPSVIEWLKECGVPEARMQAVSPELDKPVAIKAGAVEVKAFAVSREGDFTKDAKPDHVAWVVLAGGAKAVHFGSAGDPKGLDEESAKGADVLCLAHWMLTTKNALFLKRTQAKFFIPLGALDVPGMFGSLKNHREQFPRVVPMLPGDEAGF